jgi:FdhD protein
MRPVRQRATLRRRITKWSAAGSEAVDDQLVVEEPLEIWLTQGRRRTRWGLTMRTPGHDDELAAGVLYSEGLLERAADVVRIDHEPMPGDEQEFNSIRLTLAKGVKADWDPTPRPRSATSACGVCGRQTLDELHEVCRPIAAGTVVAGSVIASLPGRLAGSQTVFKATGGLHAAALTDASGAPILVREDIGRHNAVDKIVGRRFLDSMPASDASILFVSGRAGYEIVQKAIRAQIPIVAAVGAPSSLAVDAADEFGLTLCGFVRSGRFNVYAGAERLSPRAR